MMHCAEFDAFIWTPELAAANEAPQLGPSSCGATAVLNALVSRRVSVAREARSTAPKAPRPRSGLGTRLFNFFISTVSFIGVCV